jgi:hypothetical protein
MMDGPHGGAYRIKVTIRFKVRRSERFVEKKGPTKRFRGWVYSKKIGFLSIDFSLNNFSLDRGIIGCATALRRNFRNENYIQTSDAI